MLPGPRNLWRLSTEASGDGARGTKCYIHIALLAGEAVPHLSGTVDWPGHGAREAGVHAAGQANIATGVHSIDQAIIGTIESSAPLREASF